MSSRDFPGLQGKDSSRYSNLRASRGRKLHKHKHHKNVLRGVQGIKKAPSWEGAYCVCVLVMLVRLPLELRCGYADWLCSVRWIIVIAVPVIVVVAMCSRVTILDASITVTVVVTKPIFNRAERRTSTVRAFMR